MADQKTADENVRREPPHTVAARKRADRLVKRGLEHQAEARKGLGVSVADSITIDDATGQVRVLTRDR